MSGCGGDSLGPVTATLPEGAQVSPQRYLADSDAAAAAVADFSRALGAAGPVATKARLQRVAPSLHPPLERAALISQRLNAERLEDARLEAQRMRAGAALDRVVAAMRAVADAADAGASTRAVAATAGFAAAVENARSLPPVQ